MRWRKSWKDERSMDSGGAAVTVYCREGTGDVRLERMRSFSCCGLAELLQMLSDRIDSGLTGPTIAGTRTTATGAPARGRNGDGDRQARCRVHRAA